MSQTPGQLFGENLRRAREGRGWSQAGLADRAGLSSSEVYRLEKARRDPRLSTVFLLAEALEMKPSTLIRGEIE
jgi:transcriptional regulator with XRE-family HTH domain